MRFAHRFAPTRRCSFRTTQLSPCWRRSCDKHVWRLGLLRNQRAHTYRRVSRHCCGIRWFSWIIVKVIWSLAHTASHTLTKVTKKMKHHLTSTQDTRLNRNLLLLPPTWFSWLEYSRMTIMKIVSNFATYPLEILEFHNDLLTAEKTVLLLTLTHTEARIVLYEPVSQEKVFWRNSTSVFCYYSLIGNQNVTNYGAVFVSVSWAILFDRSATRVHSMPFISSVTTLFSCQSKSMETVIV